MPRPSIDGRRHHFILTDEQVAGLKKVAASRGETISATLRHVVDIYLINNLTPKGGKEKRRG